MAYEIPDEMIAENRRLRWEFLFPAHGGISDVMRRIVDEAGNQQNRFAEFVLPYFCAECVPDYEVAEPWLAENCLGVWTYWGVGLAPERKTAYLFQREEDLALFLLRFM